MTSLLGGDDHAGSGGSADGEPTDAEPTDAEPTDAEPRDAGRPREFGQHRFAAPAGSTEILLVRHGASAPHRVGHRFPLRDGHGDPALAPEGVAQAELAAERLLRSGEQIDAVYVTTLRRTHETAAPLVAGLGIEPIEIADLREVYLGEWEGGLFREKMAEGHPIALQVHEQRRWDVIPGAEPQDEFVHRVWRGISTIAAAHREQFVVAVVHGGVIGAAMGHATGGDPFSFSGASNASFTHLVVHEDRWLVRCYNDTAHLYDRFRTVGPSTSDSDGESTAGAPGGLGAA